MPLYKEVIEEYLADVFLETGTLNGEGTQLALNVGFPEVHTIELEEDNYRACVRRFLADGRVRVYHGSSADMIARALANITPGKAVTFWLDAHPGGALTLENCPTMDELAAIEAAMAYGLKVHAILIDDMRLFSQQDQDWMAARLSQMLPGYSVFREKGIEDNDVLTAYLAPDQ